MGNQSRRGSSTDIDTSNIFFPGKGATAPKKVGSRSGKRRVAVSGGARNVLPNIFS